ncbi:sensor histidine kinase [Massilia brevitalea]|uniref:sensor histidine kinase n=1 Tax=Massilia brevitalea TaxID=442526 RepID=UPI002738ABB8|nr:histidine kinase [Massilia brevitalea]
MGWFQSIVSFGDRVPDRSAQHAAASPQRPVSPDAEAWMVFGMRLLLALSALLTLHIGADSVILAGRWSWLIFVAYVLHSLILLVVARSRAGFWHGPVIYWVDIGWYGMMVYASGGAPSPFFSFFFFAILAASFRHGFDAGARLTLGAVALVLAAVLATQGLRTLHLLLLRTTFLLALGYMIAFWGGLSVDQRRRLALLRDVSRLSNPRFGVQHTLDSLMAKILRFYGGSTCVLLMQDPKGGWTLHTVHHPRSGRALSRMHTDEAALQPLLALGDGATILYRGSGRRWLPGAACAEQLGPELAWEAIDPAGCSQVADLLDTDAFVSATLPLRKGSGRIFVTSAPGLRRGDATFLNHIAQQAFPVIETIDLLDRLASEAAFRERQTIARDLHDSTIQPYIGLRHAVAAIRQQAGDGSSVAPDLERLMEMCSGVIGDMREFAQRFRNGRQEEPELQIALRRQLNQVRAFYDVHVTLDAEDAPGINDRLAAEVFQIVAEGVNNICKHTRARNGRVRIGHDDGLLLIDISNPADGAGGAGFAPRSIAERVAAMGGTLAVDAGAQQTVLRVRVPI